VTALARRRLVLILAVPICAAACGAAQRRAQTQLGRTQVTGATVEAHDPGLAAVLLLLKIAPSAARHRDVAAEYRRLGILDTAFDHLTAATKLNPRDAAAYDARARIWRDWGYPGLGLADAARAVYYAPRSAAARNTYGTLLVAAGLPVDAKREFETALKLDPGAEFARTNLCRLESVGNSLDRPAACAAPERSSDHSR
jgi:Tfp pilus assembly protein PilF